MLCHRARGLERQAGALSIQCAVGVFRVRFAAGHNYRERLPALREEEPALYARRHGGGGHSALFVANANGTGDHRITPWRLDAGDNPDWSPDGNWIGFRTHVRSDQGCQIEIIHPDGSGTKQLTHFNARERPLRHVLAGWKAIVLGTDNSQGGNPSVYVMNLDGSDLHKVTASRLWDSAADWGVAQ